MRGLKQIAADVRAGWRTAMATPAYNSTGTGNATRGWDAVDAAINALIQGGGDLLTRQSRDMVRRNPWANNAAESFVSNAVGAGIVPQPKHPDPKTREKIQQLWLRSTDEADASGLTDFYGLQSLACRSTIEGGESFLRLRPRFLADGLSVPLQGQLLESEYLPLIDSRVMPNGNTVRWGIEFDQIGRRVAYHMYREHPRESQFFFNAGEKTVVVANQILHLFKPLRPGQQRGQPWLTPVLLLLHTIEKYDRAELVRKGVAALVAFFEEDMDGSGGPSVFGRGGETDESGTPLQGVEPGSYIQVRAGKKVEVSKPVDVGGMYVEFMRCQLRKVAAGLGITYEQLSGDLTGVSYSSVRAGLLEFRRRCEAFQHQVLVYQFCRPWWRAWCTAAALAGAIDRKEFASFPERYLDVEWSPPAWEWVDPLKDAEAEIALVDNLIKSRTQVIKGRGYDPEVVDREIAADQEREDKLKLRRNEKAAAPTTGFPTDQKGPANEKTKAA